MYADDTKQKYFLLFSIQQWTWFLKYPDFSSEVWLADLTHRLLFLTLIVIFSEIFIYY
jgi:hypothetical protein